jgi:endoglucanase
MTQPPTTDGRRASDRRAGAGDVRQAPGGLDRRSGIDRRSGLDRRSVARSAVATVSLATTLAIPGVAGPPRSPTNPLIGATWWVDPNSHARKTAEAWRPTRPADAAQIDKIAVTSTADWFGNWNSDVMAAVDARVTTIAASGHVPVLVAYNIPNRDCGSYSGGGAASAAAYREWIRRLALGIDDRRAVVILEPDALAQMSQCASEAEQRARMDLLWDAVDVLKQNPATIVYVDAGHSRWLKPEVAAQRLALAGVRRADGFSLNVSNFNPTAAEVAYGRAVSARLGGKHFVIDTSRNGLGPSSTWCNPGGQALGTRPSTATVDAAVDAYLWVKRPGQSDGECNGGPRAGEWWPDYALGLAQRSAL